MDTLSHPPPILSIVPSLARPSSASSASSSAASSASASASASASVASHLLSNDGRAHPKLTQNSNKPPIWWSNIFFFVSVHLIGIYGAVFISPINKISFQTIILCFLSWQLATFGITIGYHRLWSHRAFKASIALRWFLSLIGCLGFQGSIRWWVLRHRLHHRWTDSDSDPYNSKRGLFFSHMGWIFRKPKYEKLKLIDRADLDNDPVVNFQHKHYISISLFVGFILPHILSEFILRSNLNSSLDGLIWAGFVSRILIWHFTFLINSFAHYFGERLFDLDISARSNFLLAIFTGGEANHNYHHVFPKDYRNGPGYLDWDPSKWIIYLLHRYTNLVPKIHYTDPAEVELVRRRVLKITSSKRKNARSSRFEDIHHISLLSSSSSSSSSSSDIEFEPTATNGQHYNLKRRRQSVDLLSTNRVPSKPALERWNRDDMLMKLIDYYEAKYSSSAFHRSRLNLENNPSSDTRSKMPHHQPAVENLRILVIDNTLVDITHYFNSAQHPGGNQILKRFQLNLSCLQDLHTLIRRAGTSTLTRNQDDRSSSSSHGGHDNDNDVVVDDDHRHGNSSLPLSFYQNFDRFKGSIEYKDCFEEFSFELNIHSNFASTKMKQMRIARLVD